MSKVPLPYLCDLCGRTYYDETYCCKRRFNYLRSHEPYCDHLGYGVGLFWSSSDPTKQVVAIYEEKDVEAAQAHPSFIRWITWVNAVPSTEQSNDQQDTR